MKRGMLYYWLSAPLMNMHNLKSALACAASFITHRALASQTCDITHVFLCLE